MSCCEVKCVTTVVRSNCGMWIKYVLLDVCTFCLQNIFLFNSKNTFCLTDDKNITWINLLITQRRNERTYFEPNYTNRFKYRNKFMQTNNNNLFCFICYNWWANRLIFFCSLFWWIGRIDLLSTIFVAKNYSMGIGIQF